MRIVAGRWRGRRLVAPEGLATRPTTDRTREALFSILGRRVDGAPVVDLCCGAGGLGLEALSRGAAVCDFVDTSPRALAAVRANLAACRAEPGAARLHRADAVAWLTAAGPRLAEGTILLADPPYAERTGAALWDLFLDLSARGRLAVAVLEHGGEHALRAAPAGWRRDDRRYGAATLSLLEPSP
ncbi:MAG: 16S rRNA (guanine(966)-N(2))-methyltransferase RsmD [bacterium]|nr:16S rRNA (guanine(966)-N(2))-methyltransferase RsmD [bacterium]